MRTLLGCSLLALGCASPTTADEPGAPGSIRIADLWENQDYDGLWVKVGEAQISSGRLAFAPAFYVQEASQSAPLGLRVDLHGLVNLWPPPVGTLVELTGVIAYVDEAPRLALAANDDGIALGTAEIVFNNSPESYPLHSLVSIAEPTVSSEADPSGRADTDAGLGLESSFGVAPPSWDNSGQVSGIVTSPGRLSLRSAEDWQGTSVLTHPLAASLAEIRSGAIADGTPVSLEALQGTPFSADERWAVLQDTEGRGIWLDTGFWALSRPHVGTLGNWLVEVREGGGLLRAWNSPEITGTGSPLISDSAANGALIIATLEELGPPDSTGERLSDSYLVDDRFVDIEEWAAPLTVEGAVRIPADSGELTLCPYKRL
jgi:hypothetical protein